MHRLWFFLWASKISDAYIPRIEKKHRSIPRNPKKYMSERFAWIDLIPGQYFIIALHFLEYLPPKTFLHFCPATPCRCLHRSLSQWVSIFGSKVFGSNVFELNFRIERSRIKRTPFCNSWAPRLRVRDVIRLLFDYENSYLITKIIFRSREFLVDYKDCFMITRILSWL